MRKPYFLIFQDRAGEWRWTLYGANHEPVATSEGYSNGARAALQSAERVRIIAFNATIQYA